MHAAVMSCDFLLAAAYCDPDSMGARVADLAEYARSVQAREEYPLLEIEAMSKLIASKRYPCESLFKNNLAKAEEQTYSAKDIARIISNILESGEEFNYSRDRLWEAMEKDLVPECSDPNPQRNQEVLALVEEVCLFNELESKNFSILHFCLANPTSEVEFSAKILEVVPAPPIAIPFDIKRKVKFYSDYRDYLTSLSFHATLLANPEDVELIKEAFFWGTLCDLKKRHESLELISPNSFSIGKGFIDSLKENQCLPGQNFWGVCFSSVVAVLAKDPAYAINIFKKSEKNQEQRTIGKYKAFRTHVTKGGAAIRLMFWDNGAHIQLANVGPKNELIIIPPD